MSSRPYVFFISCVERGTTYRNLVRIVAIGNGVSRWTAEQVESHERYNTAHFYVTVGNQQARVVVRRQADGDLYFTTLPDGYLLNNLQSLPDC